MSSATTPGLDTTVVGRAHRLSAAGRVTLRGKVVEVSFLYAGGSESAQYRLHLDDGRVVRLVAAASSRLRSQARMAVTGVLSADGSTLSVESTRLLRAPATSAAAAAPRSTRALVLRVFWNASAPAHPTTLETKNAFFVRDARWWKEASYGRYAVTGAVTPWMKVPAPGDCMSNMERFMNSALAAARHRGIPVGTYTRYILYFPKCIAGSLQGWAYVPGNMVWLNGDLSLRVTTHEQGHNLGLRHAMTSECVAAGKQVLLSSNCYTVEYGDPYDVMGGWPYDMNKFVWVDGHFSVYNKVRLGWVPGTRLRTLGGTGGVTLVPFEPVNAGVKGLRIRVSSLRSYWLEYRTAYGQDADFPVRARGVQLRLVRSGDTALLDGTPGSSASSDFADTALVPGSSYTTPERIRISLVGQTPGAAKIAVRFNAPLPRAPNAPTAPAATAGPGSALVTFQRPADNGTFITRYVVTASPGGQTKVINSVGGLTTRLLMAGLTPGTAYRFKVSAVNNIGISAWSALSNAVTPLPTQPAVRLTAPVHGAIVQGNVTLTAQVTINDPASSGASHVEFYLDGTWIGDDYQAPWAMVWSSADSDVTNGVHTLRARVLDLEGRSAWSAPVTITVNNPVPVITSPAAGSTVSGVIDVQYTLPPNVAWSDVSLYLGDEWVDSADQPGTPFTVDLRAYPVGQLTLTIRAYDANYNTRVGSSTVNHVEPARSLAITSPAEGATVADTVFVNAVSTPADWPWEWGTEILIDGVPVVYIDESGAELWVGDYPPGTHTIVAKRFDGIADVSSAPVNFVIDSP